jgi:hypothetical protein
MFSQFFEIKKISSKGNLAGPSTQFGSQKHIPRIENSLTGQSSQPKSLKPRESFNPKKAHQNLLPVSTTQDPLTDKKMMKTQTDESSLAKYLQIRSHRFIGETPKMPTHMLATKDKLAQKSGISLNQMSPRNRQLTQSPPSKLKSTLKNIETKNLWPVSNGKTNIPNQKVTSIDKNRPADVSDNGLSHSAIQMKLQSKVSNEYVTNPYSQDRVSVPVNIFSTYNTSQNRQLKNGDPRDAISSQNKQSKMIKNFIVKPGFNAKSRIIEPLGTPPSKSQNGTSLKNPELAITNNLEGKDQKFSQIFFNAAKENNQTFIKKSLDQLEVMGHLAKYKIDTDFADEEGSSLVHFAVWHKNEQLFYFLLSIKADFDRFNNDGITPLMLSALIPWRNAFSILSNIVRNINTPDRYGNTALHYAVVKENLDIVSILLQRPNVLTECSNDDNRKPIDIAHPRIAVKLQEMFLAYRRQGDVATVDIEIFEEELQNESPQPPAKIKSKSRDKSKGNDKMNLNINSHRVMGTEELMEFRITQIRKKKSQSKELNPNLELKGVNTKNIGMSDITGKKIFKDAKKMGDQSSHFVQKININDIMDPVYRGSKRTIPTPTNGMPQSMSTKNLGFGANKKSTANLFPIHKTKESLNTSKPVIEKIISTKPMNSQNKEFLGNLFKKPSGEKIKNYATLDQRPNITRVRTEPDECVGSDNLKFLKHKLANEAPIAKVADKGNFEIYKSVEYESFKKMKNAISTKIESGSDVAADTKVNLSNFNIHSIIGKGSFGQVFLVEKKDSNMFYAMKVLPKQRVFKDNLKRYAITERNVLSTINHPFIVKLHFAFQNKENLFLIMDYQPGGDLGEYLQDEGRFSERRSRIYISEIILAVEELHRYNIIFRDLKPENILLDAEGHAMLTDFGLSKENVYAVNKGAKSFCGSVAYLAPEMIKKAGHGKAMDWYLLGVVLYEMVTGIPPFYAETKEELFHNIQHTELKVPDTLSSELQDLLHRLLEKDPNKRIVVDEIKAHRWFKDMNWEEILTRKLKPPKPNIKRLKLYNIKDRVDFLDNKRADFFEIDGWTFIESNSNSNPID